LIILGSQQGKASFENEIATWRKSWRGKETEFTDPIVLAHAIKKRKTIVAIYCKCRAVVLDAFLSTLGFVTASFWHN
jgi:hypothetical protein